MKKYMRLGLFFLFFIISLPSVAVPIIDTVSARLLAYSELVINLDSGRDVIFTDKVTINGLSGEQALCLYGHTSKSISIMHQSHKVHISVIYQHA
ncbi:MAG: hypothetical protein PVI92_14220 [Chromatiales bacterium]|jgi:hypothetical protein